ncbi:MAG: hypothetical protein WBH50_20460, partial [Fuerstiella sp.]
WVKGEALVKVDRLCCVYTRHVNTTFDDFLPSAQQNCVVRKHARIQDVSKQATTLAIRPSKAWPVPTGLGA